MSREDFVNDRPVPLVEMVDLSEEEREMVRNGLPDEIHDLEEEIIRLCQNIEKREKEKNVDEQQIK
jgi:hypothetical protein